MNIKRLLFSFTESKAVRPINHLSLFKIMNLWRSKTLFGVPSFTTKRISPLIIWWCNHTTMKYSLYPLPLVLVTNRFTYSCYSRHKMILCVAGQHRQQYQPKRAEKIEKSNELIDMRKRSRATSSARETDRERRERHLTLRWRKNIYYGWYGLIVPSSPPPPPFTCSLRSGWLFCCCWLGAFASESAFRVETKILCPGFAIKTERESHIEITRVSSFLPAGPKVSCVHLRWLRQ